MVAVEKVSETDDKFTNLLANITHQVNVYFLIRKQEVKKFEHSFFYFQNELGHYTQLPDLLPTLLQIFLTYEAWLAGRFP